MEEKNQKAIANFITLLKGGNLSLLEATRNGKERFVITDEDGNVLAAVLTSDGTQYELGDKLA